MQKPSEFFAALEAEQAALGFEVFVGDGGLNQKEKVEFWCGVCIFRKKEVGSVLHHDCIYRRPIPKPAPAPFVDLPIEWPPRGPRVEVLDNHGNGLIMDVRPGLLHVVDGHRYRLEKYVQADKSTFSRPTYEGRLATAARFYLEVKP